MSEEKPWEEARTVEHAEMFGNRLRKNVKHLRRWARRTGVTCLRLYDRDIPEVSLVVDDYEGRLHIAEVVHKHGRDEAQQEAYLGAMVEVAREATGAEEIFLKRRERQRGASQYERFSEEGKRYEVSEGGHRFIVNLSDYLDTGLFLDHRNTRAEVQAASAGKRVLNLFAYTGAFSVYAAAGGAAETTTMDLSRTYLGWAEENLALNGFVDRERHRLVRADCCAWLRDAEERGRYDLIVVDPPSFSNSKAMDGTWDVQRDHVWLLQRVLVRVAPGGTVYFSTNRRGFVYEGEGRLGRGVEVEEISRRSVPEDFRDKQAHRCFVLRRTGA